ncbi:hypothetical protein AVEN_89258-1 [Araneus ventricosus]|uniref:Uncharacterized protein n=1 Tax=Araneus ventricosus TaxID=182803 RepID=A0A4Y2P7V3_ARAVE|nr:hypothetical protein AVEN_89258-1 [Araneus ventricosus]
MTSKSSIVKEPLTEMQMPSLEETVKRAVNIARMQRKSSEWKQTFPQVLTTEHPLSSSDSQKAQLEDPAIRTILGKKLNSDDRPSWQELAPEAPAT